MKFDSSAKPKLSPDPILKLFIPITFPSLLIKGPPEFPGFRAASVWFHTIFIFNCKFVRHKTFNTGNTLLPV